MTRSLRIAVADDEADMRDWLRLALKRMGHEVVVVAANGRELLEACVRTRPDLVITDIKMDDMDGLEAAAELYRLAPVPIILVSAHYDPDLIDRAVADHVLNYLIKPIRQADLEPAIALAVRRFEQLQNPRD